MHLGVGDYYSLTPTGYSKHANVQVIGVDSRQPYKPDISKQIHPYFSEKQIKNESIIKEQEEMEYDNHQHQIDQGQYVAAEPYRNQRLKDMEEVNSMYIDQKYERDSNQLIYSCIPNGNGKNQKPIKHRLDQIQKNNVTSQSQDSGGDDKHLYLELEKEKKLRIELEKSYKNLLSEIQRNQRYYSVDLNHQLGEETQRRRQFSKRTLKAQHSNDRLIQEDQLRSPHSAKISKCSGRKTVKNRDLKQNSSAQKRLSSEAMNEHEQYTQQNEGDEQAEILDENELNLRGQRIARQQIEDYQDYFNEQRQFQDRILENIQQLNKKVQEIDHFLVERQHQREKEVLRRKLAESQKELERIVREHQGSKCKKELSANENKAQQIDNNQIDFLQNIPPNSLYLLCILLMAVVAIA